MNEEQNNNSSGLAENVGRAVNTAQNINNTVNTTRAVGKGTVAAGKTIFAAGKALYIAISALAASGSLLLVVLPIIIIVVAVAAFLGWSAENEQGVVGGIYDFTGFNISSTLLSKEEFKAQLKEAVNQYPTLSIFADNANDIYDIASSEGVNPELVVIRAISEGFSPGTSYNYWGIGCTNTGGGGDCEKFDSFTDGVRRFIDIASRYSDLTDLMSSYSHIGDYWYSIQYLKNGEIDWGIGGCSYASYIYSDIPSRVQDACNRTCSKDNTSDCVETNEDDQAAYAMWQVSKMAQIREDVFNIKIEIEDEEDVIISNDDIIMLSDEEAWNLITGYSSSKQANLFVTKNAMDKRVVDVVVPIRVWSSSDKNDYSTKKATVRITVNKALSNLYYKFFNDIYNEATDFVINPSEIYCYSYRASTGGTRLSAHAYGAACDVNWSTTGNGYGEHVYTSTEWNRLSKSKSKYQIVYKGSKVAQIAHRYTLSWGGEWNSATDAMHFSFIGDESRATLQTKY